MLPEGKPEDSLLAMLAGGADVVIREDDDEPPTDDEAEVVADKVDRNIVTNTMRGFLCCASRAYHKRIIGTPWYHYPCTHGSHDLAQSRNM